VFQCTLLTLNRTIPGTVPLIESLVLESVNIFHWHQRDLL